MSFESPDKKQKQANLLEMNTFLEYDFSIVVQHGHELSLLKVVVV